MKIIIRNLQKKIPINPKRISSAILNTTISCASAKKPGEITVVFVNDKKIRQLNLKYLGENHPTDVLAFDLGKACDIVISTETAARNAGIFGTNSLYEIVLYTVHGMLHLLGYDDRTIEQKRIMAKKEKIILRRLKYVHK